MKTTELALNFLQKNQAAKPLVPPAPGMINAFHSLFSVQDLDDLENQAIETILQSGMEPGSLEKELGSDAHEIKRLTKELRAIRRQELVLIGERVAAARDVFRKYKDRSFRDWMHLTFGSFKTGYNYLAFYDLYLSVPDEIKMRLKDMPAKAVYVLASHKAPLEKKIDVLKNHPPGKTAESFLSTIRETLGISRKISRKEANDRILTAFEKNAVLLSPEHLDSGHCKRLASLVEHLTQLLNLSN